VKTFLERLANHMSRFIAAMDHSGGSTGGVLERYGQQYTEEDKMDKVHAMRLRMVNSPAFVKENIWAAILYKDTVERGMVSVLNAKGIKAYLKVDGGCADNGTLKKFDVRGMIDFAKINGCVGTKMRSIVKSKVVMEPLLEQQFSLAQEIANANLMPIVEPEIPIDHPSKELYEYILREKLEQHLNNFSGKCILKLTLPENDNFYSNLMRHKNVRSVVGLSGGYSTQEACERLNKQSNMTASFSRALSEGLYYNQTYNEFDKQITSNIMKIKEASSAL